MKNIIERQIAIQKVLARSMVAGGIVPPHMHNVSVGAKYDTIQSMQHFLNQEIDELQLALSGGDRDIHKPWKESCKKLRDVKFDPNWSDVKGEAIDILCFALNICIAAGIDETNIDSEYEKVVEKIIGRVKNE